MSSVPPTVPPVTPSTQTSAVTASPGSAGDPSQGQQQAGNKQGGGQTPQQQAPAPAAPAVTLAASLVGLREGMRFKGAMTGNDPSGQPVVRTPNGTFILEGATGMLAANSDVELEITGTGNQIRALLLAIGGKPQHPPIELKLTLTGVGPDATGGRSAASLPGAPGALGAAGGAVPRGFPQLALTVGNQVTATVQNLIVPSGTSLLPGSPPLTQGATLILKLVDITTPAGTPPGTSTPNAGAGATPGSATTGGAPPGATAPAVPPADDGLIAEVKARLAASNQSVQHAADRSGISGNPARLASVTALPTPVPTAGPGAGPGAPATAGSSPQPGVAPQPGAAPQAGVASPAGVVSPSATTGPAPAPGVAGSLTGSLVGEVTAQSEAGRVIVRTPLGEIALATRAALPPGTRLTFETVALRAPESPAPPSVGNLAATRAPSATAGAGATAGKLGEEVAAAVRAFATEWPALKEALTLLQSVNPGLAQQIATTVVPNANNALANSILVFLAALRGGDVRGWLGDAAARSLESNSGGRDLMNRLSSEMAQMGRAADALSSGDWRALPFPFFDGANLQQIWAFVREHRRAADQEDQRALRFVVELDLSKLGGIQLDGLIQEKNFNLMIRSVGTLPEDVRQDIAGIFARSLEATAYAGSVVFDPASIYPISPLRDARTSAAPGGEITA